MALIKPGTDSNNKVNAETENATATVNETPAATETKEVATVKPAGALTNQNPESFFLADPEILEITQDAGYGTFTTVVVAPGTFKIAQSTTNLGALIEFQPISERWSTKCSPNSQDEESKQYFASAYDGETCDDGRSIEEALADAKAAGYIKATLNRYIDLHVFVTGCPTKPEFAGEIFTLQLSPSSAKAWNSFKKSLQMKLKLGAVKFEGGSPVIQAMPEAATTTKGNKDYTRYKFALAPTE